MDREKRRDSSPKMFIQKYLYLIFIYCTLKYVYILYVYIIVYYIYIYMYIYIYNIYIYMYLEICRLSKQACLVLKNMFTSTHVNIFLLISTFIYIYI